MAIGTNSTEVRAEADAAFAGFLTAAREFANAKPDLDVSDEEPIDAQTQLANVAEVESLDLQRENIVTIVWATGYDYDYDWLRAPVFDARGWPVQQRGITRVPGLYFLGLHRMHTFKSGLLSGVGSDAEYLADKIGAARDR